MPEPIDPQIEWIAAINGMTPYEYLATQRNIESQKAQTDIANAEAKIAQYEEIERNQSGGLSNTKKAELARLREYVGERSQSPSLQTPYADAADDQEYFDSSAYNSAIGPHQSSLSDAVGSNAARRQGVVNNSATALNQSTQANAGMFGQMGAGRQAADARSQAGLDQYFGELDAGNAMDAQNVGQLSALNGSMRQLQASDYGADVASDPRYVGMQQGSYNQFGNIASGGFDVSSDSGLVGQQQGVADAFGGWASGQNDVFSDSGLVGQQQGVASAFGDWASGMNDISSDAGLVGMQQGVYDDYGGFASGAYDLESEAAGATADAEALAAQKYALGEFKERSDAKLTDAERFLYLQNRKQQEQTMRGVRDANMRELERSGMSGSTMALSNLNASSAEAADMRQLGDLGANAKAIDRAEKNLSNYAGLSSTIADQSFERDFSTRSAADKMAINNNQQRFAGIQGQGQMATEMRNADDEMRTGNANRRLEGLHGQGDMVTDMRTADDAMRTGNADRRLTGLEGQGRMVTDMRTADDAMRTSNMDRRVTGVEGQARMATEMRTADDALRTFNKEQRMIQTRHQDNYRADQQAQAWDRGVDMSDAQFRQSENRTTRATGRQQATEQSTTNAWNRLTDQTNTGVDMNRDYAEGWGRVGDQQLGTIDSESQDRRDAADFAQTTARDQQAIRSDANALRVRQLDERAEDRRAKDASRSAVQMQQDQQEWESSQRSLLDYVF